MQARPECYHNCNFSIHIVCFLLNPTFPTENLLSSIIQDHLSIVGQLQQLPSRQFLLENFPTLKGEKLCILAKISDASQTRVLSKLQFFNTYSLFFVKSNLPIRKLVKFNHLGSFINSRSATVVAFHAISIKELPNPEGRKVLHTVKLFCK